MANGYTSAERRANVKKQLRDRHGRWIEMGAKVRFLLSGVSRAGEVVGVDPQAGTASVLYRDKNGSPKTVDLDGRGLQVISAKASLEPESHDRPDRGPSAHLDEAPESTPDVDATAPDKSEENDSFEDGADDAESLRELGFTDDEIDAMREADSSDDAHELWDSSDRGKELNSERDALTEHTPDPDSSEEHRKNLIDAARSELDAMHADEPDELNQTDLPEDVDAARALLDEQINDLKIEEDVLKEEGADKAAVRAVQKQRQALQKKRAELDGQTPTETPPVTPVATGDLESPDAPAAREAISVDDLGGLRDGDRVFLVDTDNGADDITEFTRDNGSWLGANETQELDLDDEALRDYVEDRDPKELYVERAEVPADGEYVEGQAPVPAEEDALEVEAYTSDVSVPSEDAPHEYGLMEHVEGLAHYTEHGFVAMNKALRDSGGFDALNPDDFADDQYELDAINYLRDLTRSFETDKPTTVYRSLAATTADATVLVDSLVPGATLSDHGFVSTSKSREGAIGTTGGIGVALLEISLPPGTRGVDVNALMTAAGDAASYAQEQEFLLPDGQSFRVTGRQTDAAGMAVISLEPALDSAQTTDTAMGTEAETKVDQPLESALSEFDAVNWYTSDGYEQINGKLRGLTFDETQSSKIDSAAAALSKLIASSKMPKSKMLYRGVAAFKNDNEKTAFIDSVQPGAIINDNGFLSVTGSKEVATEVFATEGDSSLLFEVPIAAGDAALNIDSFFEQSGGKPMDETESLLAGDETEQEFILPAGTSWRVASVTQDKWDSSQRVVRLEKYTAPAEEAQPDAPAEESELTPEDGVVKIASDGRPYVADASGEAVFEGDTVTSSKDDTTGTVAKIEGNGKYVQVLGEDGKKRGRRLSTLTRGEPAAAESKTAPGEAAKTAPSPDDKRQYDDSGQPFIPDGSGESIYAGAEVVSTKDGLRGTVVALEKNGAYVQVMGEDGKKRGRKASTLDISVQIEVQTDEPEAPTPTFDVDDTGHEYVETPSGKKLHVGDYVSDGVTNYRITDLAVTPLGTATVFADALDDSIDPYEVWSGDELSKLTDPVNAPEIGNKNVTAQSLGLSPTEYAAAMVAAGNYAHSGSPNQGGMSTTEFIELPDGSRAFHKVVTEAASPGSPGGAIKKTADAEVLSSKLAEALGIDGVHTAQVPNTVDQLVSEIVPGMPAVDYIEAIGEWTQYMSGKGSYHLFGEVKNGREIALLDLLIGNEDRHGNNWFVDPKTDTAYPIDHGLSFTNLNDEFVSGSPFIEYFFGDSYWKKDPVATAESLWTVEELDALYEKIEPLAEDFSALGRDSWYELVVERLDNLIKNGGTL